MRDIWFRKIAFAVMGNCCATVEVDGAGCRKPRRTRRGADREYQHSLNEANGMPLHRNATEVSGNDAEIGFAKPDARESTSSIFRENLSAEERQ